MFQAALLERIEISADQLGDAMEVGVNVGTHCVLSLPMDRKGFQM